MPPKTRSVNNLKRSTLKGDRRIVGRPGRFIELEDDCDVDSHLVVPTLSFQYAAAIVSLTAILCYWNSCEGAFVFDDTEAVIGNKDLNPDTPLANLFIHDFWGSKLATNKSHKSYRPLTVLTFRWNYWLAGGLKPWGFRVVNIVVHAVNCVLALPLFSVLFGGAQVTEGWKFKAPRASFLCTLLFAVHPIHTESVAGVVGRADLLCTLCAIISFLFYVQCCHPGYNLGNSRPELCWPSLLSSIVFCSLAMLFKEQGITILGICCMYDIIVACRIDLLKLLASFGHNNNKETPNAVRSKEEEASVPFHGLIYRQTALFISGILLLIARWQIMGSSLPSFKAMDNPASFEESFLVRVINYNYIYALNCWIMLDPWWLCFDWSMGCVPLIETPTDLRILAPLAMWLVLLGLIWRCLAGANTQFRR